jgi:NAD(P) transhydrogenase
VSVEAPVRTYDLIVVGSGPAGEKSAAQAAYFGKRVALIEKAPYFGGAAANTGTLPSKTLRETALYLSGFRQRGLYGIEANLIERASVADFLRRKRIVRDLERERITANLDRHNVDIYRGTGTFRDAHHMEVHRAEGAPIPLKADVFLIATGSRPYRPPMYPFGEPGIYDSDSILDIEAIPHSMLVSGGGVIGCEYACIFAALGVKVTVIEARDQILSFLDDEVSAALKERMESLGVTFFMNTKVGSVTPTTDGRYRVTLESQDKVTVETVLVASGRNGNTEDLNLPAAGITVGPRNQIPVDEHFQTVVPHIYAAGDVIGIPALASAAMEQGRLAMCHAFHLDYKREMASILPYGIYTIPEVSVAGETEEDACSKGIPVVVGKAYFRDNARGQIIGENTGFLKLVYTKPDMRLIGAHVIGEQATELIHIGLTAILAEQGADLFIRSCYNYPTLAEAYKYATYDALGRLAREAKETL